MLIALPAHLAIVPVAHPPVMFVEVAAAAIPILPDVKVRVACRLAGVAIAKPPMPPIVVATFAAYPIISLPLRAWLPIRSMPVRSNQFC